MCAEWSSAPGCHHWVGHGPLDVPSVTILGAEASVSMYVFTDSGGAETAKPGFRHLLVNGSAGPVRGYHVNAERSHGVSNTEIRDSDSVSIYGHKTEGNYPAVIVDNSSRVLLSAYGGNAAAFPFNTSYPSGYPQVTPTLFRVNRTSSFRLAQLVDYGRTEGGGSAGSGEDPSTWDMALVGGSGASSVLTAPLERPALMIWGDDRSGQAPGPFS
jgi:hypothetical protein